MLDTWEFRAILEKGKALNPLRLKASEMAPHCINCPNTQRYISSLVSSLVLSADNFIFPCNYKKSCYNAIKSLRLYILFLVALGLTGSCVLYKAANRAEENPLPGHFLVLSYD